MQRVGTSWKSFLKSLIFADPHVLYITFPFPPPSQDETVSKFLKEESNTELATHVESLTPI